MLIILIETIILVMHLYLEDKKSDYYRYDRCASASVEFFQWLDSVIIYKLTSSATIEENKWKKNHLKS